MVRIQRTPFFPKSPLLWGPLLDSEPFLNITINYVCMCGVGGEGEVGWAER